MKHLVWGFFALVVALSANLSSFESLDQVARSEIRNTVDTELQQSANVLSQEQYALFKDSAQKLDGRLF